MIFRALCYKNCILWKRNKCLSICETVLPVTLTMLLVVMRILITKDKSEPEQYLQFSKDFNYTYQYNYPEFYPLDEFPQVFGPCFVDDRLLGGFIGSQGAAIRNYFAFQLGISFDSKLFPTRQDYEDYINSDDYWSDSSNSEPPLCFVVEYDDSDNKDAFTIYVNDQNDRFSKPQIPSTKQENFGLLKLTPDKKSYQEYKVGGFMLL